MTQKSFKNFEIMQQVDRLRDGNIKSVRQVLDTDDRIEKYAYILHDKDKTEDGKDKAAHYHIMIQLKESLKLSTIAKMFHSEIPEQYFNKIQSTWGNALTYLTHGNAPQKYQYDPKEVVSNFSWEAEAQEGIRPILEKIISGEIRQFNYTQHISGLTYIKHKKQIEAAFQYRADSIREANRDMKCIYISGGSGTGKTTYAKELAVRKGYSLFVSSGSNDPLDGYAGQDCIILDDLRPSCMGLSDLLKMLDNNTSSTVKSRYKNKVLECKLIIITTTLDIESFFKNVFSEEPETSVQLKRRCELMIKFPKDRSGNIRLYQYNRDSGKYDKIGEQPNPLPMLIKQEEMKREAAIQMLSLFPDKVIRSTPPTPKPALPETVDDGDDDDLPF